MATDDTNPNKPSQGEASRSKLADNQKPAEPPAKPSMTMTRPPAGGQSKTPATPAQPGNQAGASPAADAMADAARRLRLVPQAKDGDAGDAKAADADTKVAPPVSAAAVAKASGSSAEGSGAQRPVDKLRERMAKRETDATSTASAETANKTQVTPPTPSAPATSAADRSSDKSTAGKSPAEKPPAAKPMAAKPMAAKPTAEKAVTSGAAAAGAAAAGTATARAADAKAATAAAKPADISIPDAINPKVSEDKQDSADAAAVNAPFTQPVDEDSHWKPQNKRRPWIPILVAVGALAAFGLSIWFGYSQKINEGGDTPLPIVKAEDTPERVAADESINPPVADQDKSIYEKVEGVNRIDDASETASVLQPAAEQPLSQAERESVLQPPDVTAEAVSEAAGTTAAAVADTAADATANAISAGEKAIETSDVSSELLLPPSSEDVSTAESVAGEAPAAASNAEVANVEATDAATPEANATGNAGSASTSTDGSIPVPADLSKDVVAAVSNTSEAAATSVETTPQIAPADMPYRVQLGSFRTNGQAERGWSAAQNVHNELLSEMPHYVAEVDLGAEKGVFHRLQAGGFPDRSSAKAVCDWLVSQQQACLVVRHTP